MNTLIKFDKLNSIPMAKTDNTPKNEGKPKDPRNESKFVSEGEKLPPAEETEEEAPETNDSALRESAENSMRVSKEAIATKNDQDAIAEAAEAPTQSRTIEETKDGKVILTTKIGEEETIQELGESQQEAFNRYKTMEFEEGDREAAKAIAHYSFGAGTPEDRKKFEEHVSGLNEEEAKAFYKIAKKLDLGVVTKKHFKDLQDEDED